MAWLEWLLVHHWRLELSRIDGGARFAELRNQHRRLIATGTGTSAAAAIDACRLHWERSS